MILHKRNILFLVVTLSLVAVISYGQPSKSNVVWEPLSGKDNEFFVYVPSKFKTASDGGFFRGGPSGPQWHVDKSLVVFRYINNIALVMEYYEGDVEGIQNSLNTKENLKTVSKKTQGDFRISELIHEGNIKTFGQIQQFRIKNRLYILKATKTQGESDIVRAFFESVRLVDKGTVFSPNTDSQNPSKVSLPDIFESQEARNADVTIDAKNIDKQPEVIYRPRMNITPELRSNIGNGQIKLRIRYGADGNVENVDVVESPSDAITRLAVAVAKSTFFFPAEKDGKPVSVVQDYDYNLRSSTVVRVRN